MSKGFKEIGATAPVVSALARSGIENPFAIQELVIPDALEGRDILAKSRTGSGKTLAFAVPIVELITRSGTPTALILVPTRELATQVADDFAEIAKAKKLTVAAVYGGVSLHDQGRRAARAEIVVATPGRLEDFATRRTIKLDGIKILVLDEADRMLDMGFQPQVDRLVRRIPAERQTMFFSATLDGAVGNLARRYTNSPVLHEVVGPKLTVDEVDHKFLSVADDSKISTLVDLLKADAEMSLIFVRTKRGAERLKSRLQSRGINAVAIHGDMAQAARERSLHEFERGKASVLVATDVAARGLDLEGITHVINFDPPEDHNAYVHRVGRTARAGRAGIGITLVSPAQQGDVSRMAARLALSEEFEAEGMKTSPPAMAYSSHRGRSSMRRRRRRL
jgi:ATP-dependent RNA helicase RhlE